MDSQTYKVRVGFKLRDHGTSEEDVRDWIMLEPHGELPIGCSLGFEFPPGTSYEKAKEIRQYLDENISALVYWTHGT